MGEDTSIAWQCKSCLLKLRLHGHLRIVNERLADVLVVFLVLAWDVQSFLNKMQELVSSKIIVHYNSTYNDCRAGQFGQRAELVVMVVLCRPKVGLARR